MSFWEKIGLGKKKEQTQSIRVTAKIIEEDLEWLNSYRVKIADAIDEGGALEEYKDEIKKSHFYKVVVSKNYDTYLFDSYFEFYSGSKKGELEQLYDEYNSTCNPFLLVKINQVYYELNYFFSLGLIHAYNTISNYNRLFFALAIRVFRYICRKLLFLQFKRLDDEDAFDYLLPSMQFVYSLTNNLKANEKRFYNRRYR